ncbi:hypothetical protein CRE_01488 [Caenorhabditis remanei]|uniref:SGNH domain-containing protein n=1 Tax=Caenorhabditis remanei TaxID=31234 RepID=E3NRZ5_CAERE|nr:hypothetical protein CRE_01488 [Caenorhabditis remanei]
MKECTEEVLEDSLAPSQSFGLWALSDGYGLFTDSPESIQTLEVVKKNVEKYKLDVSFILSKHAFISLSVPIQQNDAHVQTMNENIIFYEKFAKKIYILDAIPLLLQNVINRPDELEPLHLNKREADRENRCEKCEFFDISQAFADGDKYLTFDRNWLIYCVDNTAHVTAAEVKLCEPVFKELARRVSRIGLRHL